MAASISAAVFSSTGRRGMRASPPSNPAERMAHFNPEMPCVSRASLHNGMRSNCRPAASLIRPSRKSRSISTHKAGAALATASMAPLAPMMSAGIEPYAWVLNKSVLAAGTRDPLLAARLTGERTQMERMSAGLTQHIFMLPWLTRPPIGFVELSKLVSKEGRALATHG